MDYINSKLNQLNAYELENIQGGIAPLVAIEIGLVIVGAAEVIYEAGKGFVDGMKEAAKEINSMSYSRR